MEEIPTPDNTAIEKRNAPKVDKNLVADLLTSLIRIPTVNPPGSETALAEFIVRWSEKNGLGAELREIAPGRSNAIITLNDGGTGPTLLFNGHMDVMPPGDGWTFDPFGGERVGDLIYGRGACDMKAGLAAMLVSAKSIVDCGAPLKGRLIITCVVDEEGPGTGTRQLLKDGLTANWAIVGEPTSLRVVTASKGDIVFELKIYGKAAHSSMPEEGVNAITKMNRVIERMESYSRNLTKKTHPILGHPTLSIDMIQGGVSPWIVPESCRLVVDRRMIPGEAVEEVKNELSAIARDLIESDKELKLDLTYIQLDEPAEVSRDEKIVQTVLAALAATDSEKLSGKGGMAGTTDARFLINDARIPTVIFGPGNLAQAHKPDEYVSINETILAAKTYGEVALKLLS